MEKFDFEFKNLSNISINFNRSQETYVCSFYFDCYEGEINIVFEIGTFEDVISKLIVWDNFFDSDYYDENF